MNSDQNARILFSAVTRQESRSLNSLNVLLLLAAPIGHVHASGLLFVYPVSGAMRSGHNDRSADPRFGYRPEHRL